ncbi:hypothetical protein BC833DRAFT_210921 [Globomyces pollinis-pini]|nr:hypothetical protein BC833DRAFT_210921 [Globomyces pollinis-pini]
MYFHLTPSDYNTQRIRRFVHPRDVYGHFNAHPGMQPIIVVNKGYQQPMYSPEEEYYHVQDRPTNYDHYNGYPIEQPHQPSGWVPHGYPDRIPIDYIRKRGYPPRRAPQPPVNYRHPYVSPSQDAYYPDQYYEDERYHNAQRPEIYGRRYATPEHEPVAHQQTSKLEKLERSLVEKLEVVDKLIDRLSQIPADVPKESVNPRTQPQVKDVKPTRCGFKQPKASSIPITVFFQKVNNTGENQSQEKTQVKAKDDSGLSMIEKLAAKSEPIVEKKTKGKEPTAPKQKEDKSSRLSMIEKLSSQSEPVVIKVTDDAKTEQETVSKVSVKDTNEDTDDDPFVRQIAMARNSISSQLAVEDEDDGQDEKPLADTVESITASVTIHEESAEPHKESAEPYKESTDPHDESTDPSRSHSESNNLKENVGAELLNEEPVTQNEDKENVTIYEGGHKSVQDNDQEPRNVIPTDDLDNVNETAPNQDMVQVELTDSSDKAKTESNDGDHDWVIHEENK